MPVNEILSALAGAAGPAGAEGSAAKLAMELLRDFVPVTQTPLGSIVAELGDPNAPTHIMLDAHIDEIGMIVTRVDDKGFLHVDRTGGVDRRVLTGAEVVVLGTKRVGGVVCSIPPHLQTGNDLKVPEWKDTFIDIGLPAERARKIAPAGTRIVLRSHMSRLLGSRVAGKALDDRAGAAAIIRAVELLMTGDVRIPCRLTVLLSTQEEVGGQGAQTAAFAAAPDQCVVVDTGFAAQPGAPADQCGKLGKGPMIGASPILDRAVTLRLRELAGQNGIAWQNDIMGGSTGTNADDIAVTRGGVRTGLLSVPIRNMHTAVEVADLDDVENTAVLLAEFVKAGGAPNA